MSDVIEQLWETVVSRAQNLPDGSYTTRLLTAGEDEILKKVGEEAIEIIVAAKSEGDERVIYEMADLFYHCLVLLAYRDLSWQEVEAELASRFK